MALLGLSLRLAGVVGTVEGFPKPLAFGSLQRPLCYFGQAQMQRLLIGQMFVNLADTTAQGRCLEQLLCQHRGSVAAALLAMCTERVCLRTCFRRRGLSLTLHGRKASNDGELFLRSSTGRGFRV